MGGWPVSYLHNAVEELNSGLPRTTSNSSRVEDLSQRPPDFKSSALKTTRPRCLPYRSPWKEIEYHYNYQLLRNNPFESQIENHYVTPWNNGQLWLRWVEIRRWTKDTNKQRIDSKTNRRHQNTDWPADRPKKKRHPNYTSMPLVHKSTDNQTDKQTCR